MYPGGGMNSNGDLGGGTVGAPPPPSPSSQPVGIYGWRKRGVYAFILILMVVVIINIALTVWIMRVLRFSVNGVDGLKFSHDGIKLTKETEFSQPVYTNQIYSSKKKSLYMMSSKDVHLVTTDKDNNINSQIVLGPKSVEATCESFTVQDSQGVVRMKIEGDNIVLGTKDASYPGDIEFGSSVSTPSVRSPIQESLSIESATSKVQIMGRGGVVVNSDAGDLGLRSRGDIFISSTGGDVHIQSPNVFMKSLPSSSTTSSSSSLSLPSSSPSSTDLFQLCACANGKLFKALAHEDCGLNPAVCGQTFT